MKGHSQKNFFRNKTWNLASFLRLLFLLGWGCSSSVSYGQKDIFNSLTANEILDSVEFFLIMNETERGTEWIQKIKKLELGKKERERVQVYTIDILRRRGEIEKAMTQSDQLHNSDFALGHHSRRLQGYFLNVRGVLAALQTAQDYDQALSYFIRATEYLTPQDLATTTLLVGIYDNISKIYLGKREYLKAAQYISMANSLLDDTSELNEDLRYSIIMSTGTIQSHLGFYQEATGYFEDALQYFEQQKPDRLHNIAVLYFNLGNIAFKLQDYELAYARFYRAKNLYDSLYGAQDYLSVDAYSSMASCLILSGKPDQGLSIHEDILASLEVRSYWDSLDFAEQILEVGADLISIQKYEKALPFIQESISFLKPFRKDPNKMSIAVLAYSYQAKLLLELGQLDEAHKANQMHRKLTNQVYGNNHFGTAYVSYLEGLIAHKSKNPSIALQYFERALEEFSSDTEPVFYYDNFSVLDILLKKSAIGLQFYLEGSDEEWKSRIKANIKQAESIINQFNKYEYSYQSGFRIREMITALAELKIDLELLTNDKPDVAYVFETFEDASSTLIASYILGRRSSSFPTSIQTYENASEKWMILRSYLEQEMKNPAISKERRRVLTDSLLSIHKRIKDSIHRNLDQRKQSINPWMGQEQITLKDVQTSLDSDEMMIHYMLTQQNIYLLTIDHQSASIHTEKILDMEKRLDRYLRYTANPETNIDSFIALSEHLYKKLIQPLGKLPKQLIICPHGKFQNLSFETILNSDHHILSRDWRKLPYLLKGHQIQYALSATLWRYSEQVPMIDGDFSIIYPRYHRKEEQQKATSGTQIQPLLFGEAEAQAIIDDLQQSVQLISEDEIGKEKALEVFQSSAVTHFIGHAIAEKNNLRGSKLNLSALNSDHDLYMHEIAVQHLPAQLITLSACETSSGVLERGEGSASLTRAFSLSGTKSVISTQWPVNDWSSVPIMRSFYKNWFGGMSKSAALQASKLDYIAHCRDINMAHPFYWAAFVIHGSNEQWQGPEAGKGLWVFIMFIGLMLFFIMVWRQKSKKVA
jgi:CHAT domain-containing protein